MLVKLYFTAPADAAAAPADAAAVAPADAAAATPAAAAAAAADDAKRHKT